MKKILITLQFAISLSACAGFDPLDQYAQFRKQQAEDFVNRQFAEDDRIRAQNKAQNEANQREFERMEQIRAAANEQEKARLREISDDLHSREQRQRIIDLQQSALKAKAECLKRPHGKFTYHDNGSYGCQWAATKAEEQAWDNRPKICRFTIPGTNPLGRGDSWLPTQIQNIPKCK